MKLSLHDRGQLMALIPQFSTLHDHIIFEELSVLLHFSEQEIVELKKFEKNPKHTYSENFKEPKEFDIKPSHIEALNRHIDKLDKAAEIDAIKLHACLLVKQILMDFKKQGV